MRSSEKGGGGHKRSHEKHRVCCTVEDYHVGFLPTAMEPLSLPTDDPRTCSKAKCKRDLPPADQYQWKTCVRCRDQNQRSAAKLRRKPVQVTIPTEAAATSQLENGEHSADSGGSNSVPAQEEIDESIPPLLTITLPAVSVAQTCTATSSTPETRRVFCLDEYREPIIDMMERHFNAHPLIPGYSHPSPEGIREWAVKQMYTYCVENDLQEVWAYLWENWYRTRRWDLWARSAHPEIPRLKTTMMIESQ